MHGRGSHKWLEVLPKLARRILDSKSFWLQGAFGRLQRQVCLALLPAVVFKFYSDASQLQMQQHHCSHQMMY